jgi:hypothetical protein
MELKKCTTCAEEKPLGAFYTRKRPSGTHGLLTQCKACISAYHKRTRSSVESKDKARWYYKQKLYGLSKEAFMALWEHQHGKCAVCTRDLSLEVSRGFVVDHNHSTNEVRGILCDSCNRALGLLQDSPSVLEAATAYLKTKGHYGQAISSPEAAT